MSTEFWEPWVPVVGQRVRYMFKHECPGVYGMMAPVGHVPELDREVGTMYETFNAQRNGHRFLVLLDNGRRVMAAALELEPESPEARE